MFVRVPEFELPMNVALLILIDRFQKIAENDKRKRKGDL
jgi:hypothetical protein